MITSLAFLYPGLARQTCCYLACDGAVHWLDGKIIFWKIQVHVHKKGEKQARLVARSDTRPTGIQALASSILQSGKTFFRRDWS